MGMQKVITSTLRLISVVLAAGLLPLTACGDGGEVELRPVGSGGIPTLVASGEAEVDGGVAAQASAEEVFLELVARREEAMQTIAALPTPTLPPTPDLSGLAAAQILDGGRPLNAGDDGLIPEPQDGIWWYRASAGDWTDSGTRESNPYAPLFDATSLESRHPSFAYGGIQEKLARMLAEQAEILMPELQGHGAKLVGPLQGNLGWEIAGEELPVARIWSSFTYSGPLDSRPRRYRLGGVMLFQVRDYLEPNTGDLIYQYLDVGYFLGKGVLMEDEGPLMERERRR